jgi:hypothetical protein
MTGEKDSNTIQPSSRSDGDGQTKDRMEAAGRLSGQLAVLRSQVSRLQDALHQTETLRQAAQERLDSLRRSVTLIEQALGRNRAAETPVTSLVSTATLTPAAESDAQPRRHAVTIDLYDRHVHALKASGVLSAIDADNPSEIARTVQALLDRWSEHYRDRDPFAEGDRRDEHFAVRPAPATFESTESLLERLARRRTAASEAHRAEIAAQPQPAPERRTGDSDNVVRLGDLRPHGYRPPAAGGWRPVASGLSDADQDLPLTLPSSQHSVGGVEREAAPDAEEDHQPRRRKGFAESKHRQKKLPSGRDVLQQPEGGQTDPTGAGDEQDQG